MTVNDYLSLITSQYVGQPNFAATISTDVGVPVQVQQLLSSMIAIFDIDTPPVGNQLDIIGQWVGVSRSVAIPIAGAFFRWAQVPPAPSDTYLNGWDYGTWQPSNAPSEITVLPDDAYLTLIKAKIASNNWDGTTNGAYSIWDALFATIKIFIFDRQNMSYDIAIIGGIIDTLTLALITGGYIQLRPEGVKINNYYVSIDSNPVFAWDLETTLLQGWDEGSWAVQTPA